MMGKDDKNSTDNSVQNKNPRTMVIYVQPKVKKLAELCATYTKEHLSDWVEEAILTKAKKNHNATLPEPNDG